MRALMSRAACSGEISVFSDILIFLFGVKIDIELENSSRLQLILKNFLLKD